MSEQQSDPPVQRKTRQASDAKWRANMYICFSMLKFTDRYPNMQKMRTKNGRITRLDALRQSCNQIPKIEAQISALLEEKNRLYGSSETVADMHAKFQTLTSKITLHVEKTRKAKINASINQTECSNNMESGTQPTRSDSRTSIAGSYISDISSTIDGMRSINQSPQSTSSSVQEDDESEEEDVAEPKPPAVIRLHPSHVYVIPSALPPSLPPSIYQNASHGASTGAMMDVEKFIDLNRFSAGTGPPVFPTSPLVHRVDDPPINRIVRGFNPRRILPIESYRRCRNLVLPSKSRDLHCEELDEPVSINTRQHQTADPLEDNEDLMMYDSSPETSKLRGKRDPMISVDSTSDQLRSELKRRRLTYNSPKDSNQSIISPWKNNNVDLDSSQLMYQLEY